MKRQIITALLLCLSLYATAQSTYIVTEAITQSFKRVTIDSGCHVRIVMGDTNLLTIQTLTPDSLAKHPVGQCSGKQLEIQHSSYLLSDSAIILTLNATPASIRVDPDATLDMQGCDMDPKGILIFVEDDSNILLDENAEKLRNRVIDRHGKAMLTLGVPRLALNVRLEQLPMDNPYATVGRDLGFDIPIRLILPINKRWSFYTGTTLRGIVTPLANHVTYSNGELHLQEDANATTPLNYFYHFDVDIPLMFRYNAKLGSDLHSILGGDLVGSFNFGLSVTHISNSALYSHVQNKFQWVDKTTKQKVDILNPWQISLHAGITSTIINGYDIDFFFNLLPTYLPETGIKTRSFGLTLTF